MATRLKKTLAFLCIVLAMVCFYPRAFAFVLQGEHILELMAEKLGQAESLYITQKVIFYNISPPSVSADSDQADLDQADPDQADLDQADLDQENTSPGEDVAVPESASDAEDYQTAVENEPVATIVEMEASIRYLFPQAFRSDIITDGNQRIHVYANGQALTIIDGATRAIPQTRFDFYKDLLLIRSRPELVERLTRLNVDMSISSLGRFEGRIYFVIGAQYPDESRTQIWVDQENFRPLRWIITPGAAGFQSDKLEIRYLDWWQFNDSFWYPMRIEYYQDDILVRAVKVQRYEVDASIPPELFDIEQLRSAYPPAESVSSDSGESRPVSDVQEAIEEFGKMFE